MASEKTRHIDTHELRLPNAMRNRELEVQQVAGDENVADILTKNVKSEVREKHRADMGFSKETRREMVDEFLVLSLTCCQFCCPWLQRFVCFSHQGLAATVWRGL